MFVSRETLLQDSETLVEHHEHQETEARIVETDKSNKDPSSGGLFRGVFKDKPRRFGGIIDYEDGGITRCPNCAWELEGGVCDRCGSHVYDDLSFSEDDGSTAESLVDSGVPDFLSEDDSVNSDGLRDRVIALEHREPGTRGRLGRVPRGGIHHVGRLFDHDADGRRPGRAALNHLHGTGDHIDGLSDHFSDLDSAVGDYETIGESEDSTLDSDSSDESHSTSMANFLDDESAQPFDHDENLPPGYPYYPIGLSSDVGESSHEVNDLHNDWSDAHDDGITEDPSLNLADGYASSARFSSLEPPNYSDPIPLQPDSAIFAQHTPSMRRSASARQISTSQAQNPVTIASDPEESEASLPQPPPRNRKRRHVVEDDPSNDSSASDLDIQRPRKRKSSSQDTTVGHASSASQAQNRVISSLRSAAGRQLSPIVIDSSPMRLPSTSRARHRPRADRPRLASHPRQNGINRDARPIRSMGSSSRDSLPVISLTDDASPGSSRHDRAVAKATLRTRQRQDGQPRRNAGLEIRL